MIRRLLSVRVLIGVVVLAAVLVGAWFWYRGSSLVKIRQVTVAGLSGPQVPQIRSTLTQEALTMTTLDVSTAKLRQAVSGYPEVSSLSVETHGAHALTINVVEKIPVARLGSQLVDGSGYVLGHGAVARERLPLLKAQGDAAAYASTDGQVTGTGNLAVLQVLAGAPYEFLAHVQSGRHTASFGVVLQLRAGPALYFGSAGDVGEKWRAVIDVLASKDASGACYIDVSDPQHPAAGVNSQRYCNPPAAAGGSGASATGGGAGSSTPTTSAATSTNAGGGTTTTAGAGTATATTPAAGAATATATTSAGTSTGGG